MADKIKNFDRSFPCSFLLKNFFHLNGIDVKRFASVLRSDGVLKLRNLFSRHSANQSPPSNFILRHVNTDSSSDGGGGGSTDARHTNSMRADNSTDMAGNSHRDSTHTDNTHNPVIQTQFRPKPEHPNAAREQKRILRPPMQLREVFSSPLFYLPMIRREVQQEASDFSSGATGARQPRNDVEVVARSIIAVV